MANNYLRANHFGVNSGDIDDVDDDIFLNNSRSLSSDGGNNVSRDGKNWRSTNPFDDQRQMFEEKRRQIESRTLESTQKSIGLLYETEDVGKATAVELIKQREQLEKSSRQLDEISSTLRFSQRHLNGLKSVFGGLKNYLAGNRDSQSPRLATSPNCSSNSEEQALSSITNSPATAARSSMKPVQGMYNDEPLTRMRDNASSLQSREKVQKEHRNPFESQLEANLEEMCGNLSRLKHLASDLGTEIESQNELLDNMNYKIEDVDIKMIKQNKEMNKLLGKK